MRLVSFDAGSGPSFGIVRDGQVFDLAKQMNLPTLRAVLAAGRLQDLATQAAGAESGIPLESVRLLPPIPDPGKIICVGLNYHAHVAETGRKLTEKPALFCRYPASQIGHMEDMIKPTESDQLDYEGEVAIVIGKTGRRISEQDALEYVAGYSCYNDGSVRDWQYHTSQFLPGKTFVGTGGFGPWLVTADEVPDPKVLRLTTRLNGTVMQEASVDMMITSIPAQIAYISTVLPLEAGDVIVTGTPGGVGSKRQPPVWMKEGDVIEVEVDRVGTLRNTVKAER